MAKSVAWGVTGAGAFMRESIDVMASLTETGVSITAYVSRAARSILSMYGLLERLVAVLQGPYPRGVVFEDEEAPGFPSTGRLYKGVYDIAVVSPASMNTVAKIVNGIADSLVSNMVMHAIKNNMRVLILPVDLYESSSLIPIVIDRGKCSLCNWCAAADSCPTGALRHDPYHRVRVDASKCTRCYVCKDRCPYGAISFDVEITVKPHPFYVGIVKRLKEVPGVEVIEHPGRVLEYVR
ncbi:flavoprotein [Desulfurococcus mucosus]|uniref:Flavoprotein n=1 Tax=Desulfurococcus mucosus (strain ATCC 35584 / DSM 2162 / JCM 9187 / O7/1) TaxID=765177 RepID=E8R9F1_DESM0|nr:flavoprotein [Desulfurococcus mucosus]ADV65127.1 flavoprotein [Desulfurococcus mucosus DSM 2162]